MGGLSGQSVTGLSSIIVKRPVLWPPDEGKVEQRSANTPVMLNDPNDVFIIEAGAIDVFSAPPLRPSGDGHGNVLGARRYLWTSSEGDVLFGFDAGEGAHVLVGVCAPDTRLRRLKYSEVEARLHKEDYLFLPMVEALVSRLAGAMVLRPELDHILKAGESYTLERDQTGGTLGGLVWVRLRTGQARFGGLPSRILTAEDPPLPLHKGMWLEGGGDEAVLDVMDSDQCLHSGQAFRGLSLLRSLFGTVVANIARMEDAAELDRLARKAEAEKQMRARGLAGLVSVLRGPILEATLSTEDPALVRACRLVGEPDKIEFRAPPSWETSGRVRDPLAALCRASRVRSRRVSLRGEWWKTDSGHLLAFIEQTEAPVAVLYTRKGYEIVDPDTMTRTRVDKAVAATLNWEAYAFYRPLPDEPVDGRGLLRRVLEEAKPDLIFIVWLAIAAGLLTLLIPMATERMVGQLVPSALRNQVWTLGLSVLGVHVGIALFNLTRAFTLVRIEGKTNASVQAAVVDRMLALPVPFFRDNPVGELAGRALTINAARAVLTGAAAVTVLAGIQSILYFILLLYYNWRLGLVAIAMLVITVLLSVWVAKRAVHFDRQNLAVQGKVSALVFQMIGGIAKLRVAAAEGRLFSKWTHQFRLSVELAQQGRSYKNLIKLYNDLLPMLSSLVLFWIAGYLVRNGHTIDTATFLAFNAAYGSMFAALAQVGDTIVSIMSVQPIIERAAPILGTVPEVEASKPDPGALTGRIEACHLTFAYKKDGPLVLDDVSINAAPGEYIALVGPSGSGKSTLFRMLLGFEHPNSGVIYYDGQDLNAVDLSGVRSQIGVVLQNSRLISGSVFDNIVGSAPLSMEDAWAAAEMAGFAAEIKEMPMGMHTVVSEGGGNLSGGQQQRLLIARALVRRPRILYFDEATSALDNRVQELVSQSLDRLNATRVVIAHRLSTIKNADRIYVIDKGKVAQSGSFAELGAQKGMFAELMARQRL
jgi:NHLM bacteriocin system ABC transporter ATP-binding protein